ncbi:MAG: hypothetical protein OZ921_11870 [Sorangiineae bacterium]|nr:hypothetical protein [Polyangiaceae bacterium]MEB2323202.1 hypothetical protein [Sorangiineae bacterium]
MIPALFGLACSTSSDAGEPNAGGFSGAYGGSGGGGGAGGTANTGGAGGTANTGGASGAANTGGAGGAANTGGGGNSSACGELTTFETGKAPTSELHVATNGSPLGDGTSARPFANIEQAVAHATPGTAIRVHSGTYSGGTFVSGLAGTADAPIWVGGAPGEPRPVVDGSSQALQFSRARYLVVHDLELRNASDNGMNADDGADYANEDASRYLVFRNLDIHDIGTGGNNDCLKLSGLYDYWVLDSRFARCGRGGGSGIDQVGCHRGVIARNRFEQPGSDAVQAKGGSADISIRSNLVVGGGDRGFNLGGSTGFAFFRPPLSASGTNFEAANLRVIANVIIGGEAAVAFVGCVDCVAAHNTIIDPEHWVVRILQETTTSDGWVFAAARGGSFVNNIVYYSRGDVSTSVNVGSNTDADSFTFGHNLWYAHDAPAESAPTSLPVAETGSIVGADPGFANVAAENFHIGAASPAAGKGEAGVDSTGDFDGSCWGSPPSIGAFEPR